MKLGDLLLKHRYITKKQLHEALREQSVQAIQYDKAIQIGKASNATPFFQIQLDPVMYTARMQPEEVYSQSYDFRSLDNTLLETRITQYS